MRTSLLLLALLLPGCATWVKGPITGQSYWTSFSNVKDPSWGYWEETRQDYIRRHVTHYRKQILEMTICLGMSIEECKAAWCHLEFRRVGVSAVVQTWAAYERPYIAPYSHGGSIPLYYLVFSEGKLVSWSG